MPAFNLLSLTQAGFAEQVRARYGKGEVYAKAAYRALFQHGNKRLSHLPEFRQAPDLGERMENDMALTLPQVVQTLIDGVLTHYVFALADGCEIEAVHIPMKTRSTLCISSQVGCRMACRFCETGRLGLIRSLTPAEIVGQVYLARHVLGHQIDNLVFMGMGEPLDNLDAVIQAIRVFSEPRGLNIAPRRITVSTAGLPDGIRQLGAAGLGNLHLAVSLNAAEDALRSRLMPVNRRYPLRDLKAALTAYPLPSRGLFLFEYVLLPGTNDRPSDARAIAAFLAGLPARVNLIPCNPAGPNPHPAPTDADLHAFAAELSKHEVFVRIRWYKGGGGTAGCGQLGNKNRRTAGS